MTEPFDSSPYQSIPNADVPSIIALVNKLLQLTPKKSTAEVKAAAKKMRFAVDALSEVFAAPAPIKSTTPAQKRLADTRIDRAWSALYRRVEACSMLPTEEYTDAKEAQGVLEGFFSEGLKFLTLPYEAEWAESNRRLQQIDADADLAKTLTRLAGDLYLPEIRKAHTLYGDILGITAPAAKEESVSAALDIPLQSLRRAISQYLRAMVATVDEDEPNTVSGVVRALAPIVELRERKRSSSPVAPAQPPVE